MPSNPTTKSQVQAYQFVLRRMQSALVRKDAVMLHDPMRTHSRATIVGVVIGIIGMLGFLIFGLFKQASGPPDPGIVIGEQSGTVYVLTKDPRTLVPTFNLASARLLLMAQQQMGQEGDAGNGQQGSGGGGEQFVEAQVVADDDLKDIPRAKTQGLLNGPPLLPSTEQLISNDWAVCDETQYDPQLTETQQRSQATTETAVFGGKTDLGNELRPNEALLVNDEQGVTHLIYRQRSNPNLPNANTVRAEIPASELNDVAEALGFDLELHRGISNELLNAVPAVGSLSAPEIQGVGDAPEGFEIDNLEVGTVFAVERTERTEHFVVLRTGIQPVSQTVGNLIRSEQSITDDVPTVRPDQVGGLHRVKEGEPDYLDVRHYPQQVPTVLDPLSHSSMCLGWSVKGEEQNEDAVTSVYTAPSMPGPETQDGESQLIEIGQPAPDGFKIDKFYMRPGYAAVVRSATTKETFGHGNIQLVSDHGVRYGIPNVDIAFGLLGYGSRDYRLAPESILRLLPVGQSLNPQDVTKTYDGTVTGNPDQPEGTAEAGGN